MRKIIGIFLTAAGVALTAFCLTVKIKGQMSMVIGGADGPTSIFVAGRVGRGAMLPEITVGIVLLAAGISVILVKRGSGREE